MVYGKNGQSGRIVMLPAEVVDKVDIGHVYNLSLEAYLVMDLILKQ
jgi:hypothetical protein